MHPKRLQMSALLPVLNLVLFRSGVEVKYFQTSFTAVRSRRSLIFTIFFSQSSPRSVEELALF